MELELFNTASRDVVRPALLACAAVPRWVDAVLAGRPYAEKTAVVRAADGAGRQFTEAEIDLALAAHPRIGERAGGETTEAVWSQREQSGVVMDPDTVQSLAAGNREYEKRFGRVFLICASGLTAAEVLGNLRERLVNDPQAEAAVVADELRRIALLRLERVLTMDGVRT